MAQDNPIVTGLTSYVEEQRYPLMRKAFLGGDSIRKMNKQLGIKGSAKLNLMDVSASFADGEVCGFSGGPQTEFSQRQIDTAPIKSEQEWCWKKVWGKYLESEYRVQAGEQGMPFEEEITNDLVDSIATKLETAVWQGDTTSANADLNQFDGLLKIMAAASADTQNVDIASGTSAYDAVVSIFMAIPEVVLRKKNVEILLSPEMYRAYAMDLVAKNLYHYNPGNGAATDEGFLMPGTNVRVVKVDGLAGTKKIIAASWDNLVYGCDLLGGEEEFRLWYNNDEETFRFRALWNSGVQVAFPDEIVVGTLA